MSLALSTLIQVKLLLKLFLSNDKLDGISLMPDNIKGRICVLFYWLKIDKSVSVNAFSALRKFLLLNAISWI